MATSWPHVLWVSFGKAALWAAGFNSESWVFSLKSGSLGCWVQFWVPEFFFKERLLGLLGSIQRLFWKSGSSILWFFWKSGSLGCLVQFWDFFKERLFGLLAALGVADCILQLLHFYQSHNVATTGESFRNDDGYGVWFNIEIKFS